MAQLTLPLEPVKSSQLGPVATALAKECAEILVRYNAENYVGEIITITVDDEDGPAFELAITTQKVGALTPFDRIAKLEADMEKLNAELLHRAGTIGLLCGEKDGMLDLLQKAETVINQFMPNVAKCFGVDADLLNKTLIGINDIFKNDNMDVRGDL